MSHHYIIPYWHFSVMLLENKVFLDTREKPEKEKQQPDNKRGLISHMSEGSQNNKARVIEIEDGVLFLTVPNCSILPQCLPDHSNLCDKSLFFKQIQGVSIVQVLIP